MVPYLFFQSRTWIPNRRHRVLKPPNGDCDNNKKNTATRVYLVQHGGQHRLTVHSNEVKIPTYPRPNTRGLDQKNAPNPLVAFGLQTIICLVLVSILRLQSIG